MSYLNTTVTQVRALLMNACAFSFCALILGARRNAKSGLAKSFITSVFSRIYGRTGEGGGKQVDSGMWIVARPVKDGLAMEQRLPTQAKPACVGHQHQIVVMHTKSRSLGFARDDTSRGSWSEGHRMRNSAQVSVQKKDANLMG
jgi:hypothetical protein